MKTFERTETRYTFSELSDNAKQRAIEAWRSNDDSSHVHDDWQASLKGAAKFFGLSSLDRSISVWGNSYISASIAELDRDHVEELQDLRLWKYLTNNPSLLPDLSGNCPFTGCGTDESFLDPIRAFMLRPTIKAGTTWESLLKDCMQSFCAAWVAELEYQDSDEAITESIESNWEGDVFTIDGKFDPIG